MADFGIRISKEGKDASAALSETNKKDFVFLSDSDSPKVLFAGYVEAEDEWSGIEYVHDLGYVPMFFLFETDSKTEPTYFSMSLNTASTTTTITQPWGEIGYLIILEQGAN